ncbi:hypothetical protein CYPRO_0045 [Cyclonatronum proteinivorum]|uniref:Lipoprotein n=1 Tax=Cyclonatronum proteinivorum TaxID=1457365 RepID=A0A345UFT2_9BACT|nr:hypothetical protein [Cyclonatronum proteinivorum]AXI99333.1 hypothetical protein CYPRO_0045 [Cyclonatronum proteinivorum]
MKSLASLTFFLLASLLFTACADKLVDSSSPYGNNQQSDPDPVPADASLYLFWVFDGRVANNVELERLDATFDPLETGAFISFQSALPGYPNTGRLGSMERRNAPTDVNYLPEGNDDIPFEEADVRGVQIRQPFQGSNGEHELYFHIPMTNASAPILRFAMMDEGAADAIVFDYSVTSGFQQWTQAGMVDAQTTQSLTTDTYQIYTVDLSGVEAAANNADLLIRARFLTDDGFASNGDRVTFNNVSVFAVVGE